jgi:hypothetical protein
VQPIDEAAEFACGRIRLRPDQVRDAPESHADGKEHESEARRVAVLSAWRPSVVGTSQSLDLPRFEIAPVMVNVHPQRKQRENEDEDRQQATVHRRSELRRSDRVGRQHAAL